MSTEIVGYEPFVDDVKQMIHLDGEKIAPTKWQNEMAEKIDISGVSETMLQTLYARAKASQTEPYYIYDEKAIEIAKQLDYDFSKADKDYTMSSGVLARTIVLDRMVSKHLAKHPGAVVINIACGLIATRQR